VFHGCLPGRGDKATTADDAKNKASTDKPCWPASRSLGEGWWTQQERIRTITEIPFSVALLQLEEPLLYQVISDTAKHLQQLGVNNHNISKRLGVDLKTVKKALKWLEDDE
jgi:hypothetical protein